MAASPNDGRPRLALKVGLQNEVAAPVDRRKLREVVRRIVIAEGLEGSIEVSVHLADDARLRQLNLEQRGIDAATDVLSFPLFDALQPGGMIFPHPPDVPRHLGDIVISYQRACAQAAEYGHGVEREVFYLLAHGVLHLLGHDHQEEEERHKMRRGEEAALGPLGLTR